MLRSKMVFVRSSKKFIPFFLLIPAFAQTPPDQFSMAANGKAAVLVAEPTAWPGVTRAVHDLADDIHTVSGITAAVSPSLPKSGEIVLIATVGKSPLLDKLAGQPRAEAPALGGMVHEKFGYRAN